MLTKVVPEEKPLSFAEAWLNRPNPKLEALFLYSFVQRGVDTVDDIRELIGVPEVYRQFLMEVTADDPMLQAAIERTLSYRGKVLLAFENLVAKNS